MKPTKFLMKSSFVVLVGCFAVALVAAPVQAATFCVDNDGDIDGLGANCDATCSSDDTDCYLASAIEAANANPGADEIIFDPAVVQILDGFLPDITESLTITGPGAGALEINGQGAGSRVLTVNLLSTVGTVNISGVTITNGDGGVHLNVDLVPTEAEILNLSDCVITGNDTSISTSLPGGGVLNQGGTVNVTNCLVDDNIADNNGGGIATMDDSDAGTVSGTTHINTSVISGNSTTSTGDGGGVSNTDESTTTIDLSFIINNSANDIAGGIINDDDGSTLTITNSKITGNEAVTDDAGGIYNSDGTLNVTDSEISNNRAIGGSGDDGGGLFNHSDATANLTRVLLISNEADEGGGILNTVSTLNITDSTIAFNRTGTGADDGGGILNTSSAELTITGSTIADNISENQGGGIMNDFSSTVTISKSAIVNNRADHGGGLFNTNNGSSIAITNSTISGNIALAGGGGITNDSDTDDSAAGGFAISLNHVTVTENIALTADGGGIEQETAAGPFQITGSIIANNFDPASAPDCDAPSPTEPLESLGNNILGDDSGCENDLDAATKNDQIGTAASPIDPVLAALSPATGGDPANGGPTSVHEPMDGSPAIDAVDDAVAMAPADDQRGVPRPIGAASDIGAVEVGCGDGVIQTGEDCDDAGESATCNANCTAAACGDGVVNASAGEACDDGNTDDGDGCSADCEEVEGDTDGDGVLDVNDNCPDDDNADQEDSDGDGLGDACDTETSSGGCSLIRR